MIMSKKAVAVLAVVAGLGSVTALGMSPATAVAPSPTPVTSFANAASSIEALGRGPLAGVFGGLVIDPATQTMTLSVTSTDSSTIAPLTKFATGYGLTLKKISRSYTELVALRDKITTDIPSLASSGVQVDAWGPDADSDTVEVAVSNPSTAAAPLTSRYGSAVSVVQGTAPTPAADRFHDTKPWNGGAYIDGSGSACTAGFPVTGGNGAQYMLTAGHCFPGGSTVQQGASAYGTVTNRNAYNANALDAEMIQVPAGSSNKFWANQYTLYTETGVGGYVSAGSQVCKSGIVVENNCGTVQHVDWCLSYEGHTNLCHQAIMSASSTLVGQGDSGGPNWEIVNSSYFPVGLTSTVYGSSFNCNSPVSGTVACSDSESFTEMPYIISYYDLTVH